MGTRAPISIVNLTQQRVVCEQGRLADRAYPRMRGLLGRRELPAGEGLLLEPAGAIHSAFMRFPIDVVFLDVSFRVIKIVSPLRPWRTASAHGARAVLELAAGEARRRDVCVGDRLDVHKLDEPGLARRLEATPSAPPPPEASRKILLVSADRRFRSVAGALFIRRGWAVVAAGPQDNVAALASDAQPDVAVIDAVPTLTAAAEAAAAVLRGCPAAGTVLVSAEPHSSFSSVSTHPKWGSFESLCAAVDRARTAAAVGS